MYILSRVELTGFLFYFVLFNPFTAPCTQQLLKDVSRQSHHTALFTDDLGQTCTRAAASLA